METFCPRLPAYTSRRKRGFTLLEIIVVLLVFSVMAAMAYGGLNSVLKLRRGIEDSMLRTADLQRAYLRLRQDFQNVRDRPARDEFGEPHAPLLIDRDQILTVIRGGLRNPLGGSRSSLERVRYRVKDRALMRASWTAVDLPERSEPAELALLKDVQEVRWRFLDTGYEWQTQWPDTSQAIAPGNTAAYPPPIAVELTLVTKDWGEVRFLFRTPQASLVSGDGGAGSSSTGSPSRPGLITKEGLLPASALTSAGTGPVVRDPLDPGATPDTPQASDPTPDPEPDTSPDPGIPSTGDPEL